MRLTPAVLAAFALSWPVPAARAQAADGPRRVKLEATVDPTIKPGDDFFAYANGAWLKATAIPAGKESWAARDEIRERTRARVAKLLDEAASAGPASTARKVADFRAAYLNELAIEAKGIAPLKAQFERIDRVWDKMALTQLLGADMRADVDPLNYGVYKSSGVLGLSVEPSIHGEKTYTAFLVQGGLGLPDRENYLSAEPRMQELRTKYQAYVGRMLALAGFDRSEQRAEKVMVLETAIAKTQGTREASANDRNADTIWTRADLARRAPGMDWGVFLNAAGLKKQGTFVPWQPRAVTGVAALVASQPIEAWKEYLRFHAIDEQADLLPRAFAGEAWAMHRAASPGDGDQKSRAQRAFDATQLAMSNAIGRMYAEQYFPAAQKTRVKKIVADVAAAFARRVEASTWMSPATRSVALAKVKTLYIGIGYPDQWQDYSGLGVDPADPAGNARRVAEREYARALARLGKPVDMTDWLMAPQTPGAVLTFQQNAYDFTAALLQAPKFDADASDAVNYGAIGAIIGHDISHFIDALGAEYQVDGAMRRWWTTTDSARFQAMADPLVKQFSAYRPFPDMSVNGKLSQTEDIADLAGLAAAFDAYRQTLGAKANDKAYVRQHDREFFIGFAQSWRAKLADAAMRKVAATSDHAPETYRIATVRNIDAWYDAFDVRPGDKLYLEPRARVRIW